jgi:hypothetical protein
MSMVGKKGREALFHRASSAMGPGSRPEQSELCEKLGRTAEARLDILVMRLLFFVNWGRTRGKGGNKLRGTLL